MPLNGFSYNANTWRKLSSGGLYTGYGSQTEWLWIREISRIQT
jgi:hypothetical protein